jgi:hypothetical protein
MLGLRRIASWLGRRVAFGLLFAVAYLALLPVYAAIPRLVMAILLAAAVWWLRQTVWEMD